MTFRQWLHEMWLENCDERGAWHMDKITVQQYFQQYRWWLRREYRYQQGQLQ